jgi:hypothetical protein
LKTAIGFQGVPAENELNSLGESFVFAGAQEPGGGGDGLEEKEAAAAGERG